MPTDAPALRKEVLRLLALADAENDPALRSSFIRLALEYAEEAFELVRQEKLEDPKP